jgi:tRNA(Ile)-lysidine synthase
MHPLEKDILHFIRNKQLIGIRDGTIVVAVSGGPDSMCLLHLLARLAGQLHITLVASYVNHGLRPDEAEQEQELVMDAAEKLCCSFETGAVEVQEYARSHNLSIEHAARVLRYDFLDKVAAQYRADRIALAHTADDQAEELLLRLIRGTGRTGLAGMKAMRQGKYIRPLLSTTKSRLYDYLHRNKIAFAHDSSNRQRIFLRNKIRLDLLPYLTREFNPNIQQTLLQTANILGDEEELLDNMTEQACRDIFLETGPMPAKATPDAVGAGEEEKQATEKTQKLTLILSRFLGHPRAIQRRVLEKACWRMKNKPYSKQIEQLLQLAHQKRPDGRLHLAEGLRVHKLSNRLYFTYPAGMVARRGDLSAQACNKSGFEYEISGPGTWRLDHIGLTVAISVLDWDAAKPTYTKTNCERLDLDRITFPLTIRAPQPTDRFVPLGSPGSKKISHFLIDQKVKKQHRGEVPVLVSDNTVVALLGLRIDHRFRITPATSRVLHITWQRE